MENTILLIIIDTATEADTTLHIKALGQGRAFKFCFNDYTFLLPSRETVKLADFILSQLRIDAEDKSIMLFEDSDNAELKVTGTENAENKKIILLNFMYWGRSSFCEVFILNSEQAKSIVEFISPQL